MSNTVTKIGKTNFLGAQIDEKVTKKKVNEIIDAVNPDIGTVTQTGTINSTVTINNYQGVITTVNSTLAAGTSALFQVNNSNVKATSVVLLTVENPGATTNAGIAHVNVETLSNNGNFLIRLYNIGSTPFANFIKIYFTVITP